MGVEYSYFIEYRDNKRQANEWHLAPIYVKKGDTLVIQELYWDCGSYDFICQYRETILNGKELSRELVQYLITTWGFENEDEIEGTVLDINAIIKLYDQRVYSMEAYVTKNDIRLYEMGLKGEIDSYLTYEDYKELPNHLKGNYELYAFDDYYSSISHAKRLAPLILNWEDIIKRGLNNWDLEYRLICIYG